MGKIKTALELAMEEWDNIEVDYDKINQEKMKKEGKKLAGKYFHEDSEIEDLKKDLDLYKGKDRKMVSAALKETVLQNIGLPIDNTFEIRFSRCALIISLLSGNDSNVDKIMQQIIGLCKQYSTSVDSLLQSLKDKYSEVAESRGINLEEDKDFIELYQNNLKQLKSQYQETLDKGKESLRKILFK